MHWVSRYHPIKFRFAASSKTSLILGSLERLLHLDHGIDQVDVVLLDEPSELLDHILLVLGVLNCLFQQGVTTNKLLT
jgi:hypothetical protein